jgi:Protein of unknown function (DUF3396)
VSTAHDSADRSLGDLRLQLKLRSGEYCAVRVGVTLVVYYAKPMRELAEVVQRLIDLYLSFVPDHSIQSMLSTTGVWREFSKQSLSAGLRKLAADGADYRSIHLGSEASANVGEYGFHFFGSNFSKIDVSPRETCAAIFEFPAGALARDSKGRFEEFVVAVAESETFESGYGGYAFKHLFETWRDQALPWIGQRAQRYLGLDISYDSFRRAARGRVINVSWITLLGGGVTQALGGAKYISEQLSSEVRVRSLTTGLLLVAGESAPIGDTNRGVQDIRLLKEVALLTKSVRGRMEIGFGSDAFRRGWLDRFD